MARGINYKKGSPSSKEVESMRHFAQDSLPELCDIHTLVETIDAMGSVTQQWVATYRDVPCALIARFSGGERTSGMATQDSASYVLKLPYDQTITNKMRVVHNNITYEVTRVDRDHTNFTLTYATLARTEIEDPVTVPEVAIIPDPVLPPPPPANILGAFDPDDFSVDTAFD